MALAVAAVIVIVLLLAGGEEERPSNPTSSGVDLEREKQAVIAAELGFYRTLAEANDPPNPSHPGFATYATDRAHAAAVAASESLLKRGLAFRLPPDSRSQHRPAVVSIDRSTAVVHDCAVDDGLLVDMATGKVVEGEGETETVLYTVVLVRASPDAPWKVSFTKAEQRWNGISGCAA